MNDGYVTLIMLFLYTTLIASIVFAQRRGTLCLFGRHLMVRGNLTPRSPAVNPVLEESPGKSRIVFFFQM